jgi:hypothetical protein
MNFFSNAHAYSAWTRYNKEGEGGREEKVPRKNIMSITTTL